MKKFIFAALLGTSALAFAAGAHAEGASALQSDTHTNSSAGGAQDNSYAHGDVDVNDNSISATSTTGTKAGTASGSITRDNSANGINVEGETGVTQKVEMRNDNNLERDGSEEANITADMNSKTGVIKTRAKGAMGMLNPNEIKQVQENLQSAGYKVEADGVWGNGTKEALKAYQKSKNLNVSGKMDAETRSSMGMSNN